MGRLFSVFFRQSDRNRWVYFNIYIYTIKNKLYRTEMHSVDFFRLTENFDNFQRR